MSRWCEILLRERTVISGKWHQNEYRVIRMLGKGANGAVYLVERTGRQYALKVGFDSILLQSELNGLRAVHGADRTDYLVDSDDFVMAGQVHSFYVMKYIEGISFHAFLQKHGDDWLPVLGLRVLQQLHAIHQRGYVFGDLKSDNILVAKFGQPELIDYGGLTPIGQSLRQFTEIGDRGFWHAGSRVADEAYDVFSFAMICVEQLTGTAFKERFVKRSSRPEAGVLASFIRAQLNGTAYGGFLLTAVRGGYADAAEALIGWRQALADRRRTALPASISHLLKIVFTCSILLFVFTIFYLLP